MYVVSKYVCMYIYVCVCGGGASGKGNCQSTDYTKIGKERGNSYRKYEEISRQKAHINTQKLH